MSNHSSRVNKGHSITPSNVGLEESTTTLERSIDELKGTIERLRQELTDVIDENQKLNIINADLRERLTDCLHRNEELNISNSLDFLTGLYRQGHSKNLFKKILLQTPKNPDKCVVLIRIDINWFKKINDKYGHVVGDKVLQQFGLSIKNELRNSQFAAREGGDEFLIVLPSIPLLKVNKVISRILKDISLEWQRKIRELEIFSLDNTSTFSFVYGSVYTPLSHSLPENLYQLMCEQADGIQLNAKNEACKNYTSGIIKPLELSFE